MGSTRRQGRRIYTNHRKRQGVGICGTTPLAQAVLAQGFTCALASAPLPVSASRPGGPKMLVVAAAFLAAASLGLARGTGLVSASRICVENRGTFELLFEMTDSAYADRPIGSGTRSAWYAGGEQSCLDMSTIPDIEEGHLVVTFVYVQRGTSPSAELPPVIYSLASGGEGAAASFICSGNADYDVDCKLSGGARRLQNLI
ncbi:unnamed protein product [Prorocentrum cordatum]|uniref:Uncharacterized protein n=1 Tax=Prorocentrum cordatum TaxID=2364126 RepID=A0ABN9PQQ1_9DINO|nr:unnamed protein product [Polarella glacialis]